MRKVGSEEPTTAPHISLDILVMNLFGAHIIAYTFTFVLLYMFEFLCVIAGVGICALI